MRKVLDVGGGAKPKKDATHLIDIDPNYCKRFKKTTGREAVCYDLNKLPLPFKDETFDKIYLDMVLEHLEVNSFAFLKEINRITKTHGKLYINCPNSLFLPKRIMFLFGNLHKTFHWHHRKHFLFPTTMMYMLFDTGFHVKRKYFLMPFKNLLMPTSKFIARKFPSH